MKTYKLAERKLVKWWDSVGHYYIPHSVLKELLRDIQRTSIETGEQKNETLRRYYMVKDLMRRGTK